MSAVVGSFAKFSPELLRMIAVFCDGESLITFTATCHFIRYVCHDFLTYKKMVLAQLRAIEKRSAGDIRILMRYSLSLSKTSSLINALDILSRSTGGPEVIKVVHKVTRFVPHLVILGYNDSHTQDIITTVIATALGFSGGLVKVSYSDETLLRLAFSFAHVSLSHPNKKRLDIKQQSRRHLDGLATFQVTLVTKFQSYPADTLRNLSNVYFLFGVFVKALKDQHLSTPHHCLALQTQLFSFPSFPVPFDEPAESPENESWRHWLRSICSIVSGRCNIDGSTWRGYRCYGPFFREFNVLSDVKFSVTGAAADSVHVRGDGTENGFPITLTGVIHAVTDKFSIAQNITDYVTNDWHGHLTPFGMVGYWEAQHDHVFAGFFCLWRSDGDRY
ncbi:hypothetical protein F5Y16DRAFT_404649 [Xylariaceae sp. FL0255]|nr:hypothetical protein F5Y16DRAFT_404649 [Xylariaceae sp. FL0255]